METPETDGAYLNREQQVRQFHEHQQNKEAIEQRDASLNLKAIIATAPGRNFIKYLIKNFDVGELPEKGVEGTELHETIGFLRAGQSIFQIVSQANTKIAGEILADIQGEKYDYQIRLSKIENGSSD